MSVSTDFPFICFDTEDNSPELRERIKAGDKTASMFDRQMTQIGAISARGASFYNKGDGAEFLRWLTSQPETFVYSLNIQYDLGAIFGHELDSLDCSLVGGRMIKAQWGRITFVDVFNIWFQSTQELGKVFGLKKLEMDVNSKEYVLRDVEIIREAMLFVWRFCADLGVDRVPATLGSLGVRLWRMWGGETVPESNDICRDAIFGGRVELWKTCNRGLYEALQPRDRRGVITIKRDELDGTVGNLSPEIANTDLNSLYPAMMCREFPGILESTGQKFKRLGVVHASVSVPNKDIQVLPYRTEEGKILYGHGKFSGVWTVAELEQARDDGASVEAIHASYTTNDGMWPYKTYMERVYNSRLLAKSEAERELYKRLMNCLYGRTGASGELSRTIMQTAKNRTEGVPYGSRVLVKYKMPLGEEVNWSHTAYVTSYGRLELLKYIKIIGAESMIYCDTDSCIFDCPGQVLPFPVSRELGAMKLVGWESIAIPYAPKMYRLGNRYKAKGVPKRLQQAYVEAGHAAYDMPFKFREAVAFYDRDNAKRLSVWREVLKTNRSNYDKKTLKDGRYFPCRITPDM